MTNTVRTRSVAFGISSVLLGVVLARVAFVATSSRASRLGFHVLVTKRLDLTSLLKPGFSSSSAPSRSPNREPMKKCCGSLWQVSRFCIWSGTCTDEVALSMKRALFIDTMKRSPEIDSHLRMFSCQPSKCCCLIDCELRGKRSSH